MKKSEIGKKLVESAKDIAKVQEEAKRNGKPVAEALNKHVEETKKARAKTKAKSEEKPETKAKSESSRLLYTIRLEKALIEKLHVEGEKRGMTHAAVARELITKGLK
jgi:uncharacterized protein (DUF4415 family)